MTKLNQSRSDRFRKNRGILPRDGRMGRGVKSVGKEFCKRFPSNISVVKVKKNAIMGVVLIAFNIKFMKNNRS
jgi:hypothetical protein